MRLGLESWENRNSIPGTIDSPGRAGAERHFVPPKPAALAGLFPQFEILDLLGHGGMGAVYKARQKSLDRLVALKIINPAAADDPGFASRFEREAKALARLNHPHIVNVYDFGELAGEPPSSGEQPTFAPTARCYYFVMEYVDGTNLRRLMESKELAPEQALAIVPQVCEALQFAHDEGIVHRDIKPENILVDSRGRVKIADFGLAKLLTKSTAEDHTLTGSHQVMGTPRYMAPEQMERSRAVDHRADIYSLGVVFYEMLTGELPLGRFAPPSEKVHVDVRLDDVVLRSLAKEPERRYQQASDIKTDVERISQERFAPSPKRGDSQPHPRRPSDTPVVEPAGADLPRRIALLVSLLCLMGVSNLAWPLRAGYQPPAALLACLLTFLIVGEIDRKALWWWYLVSAYFGFAVASLGVADGLASAAGPRVACIGGVVLAILGGLEFGRALRRIDEAGSGQPARGLLWLATLLLLLLTGAAAFAWGGRGRGAEDINVILVPVTALVFLGTLRGWIGALQVTSPTNATREWPEERPRPPRGDVKRDDGDDIEPLSGPAAARTLQSVKRSQPLVERRTSDLRSAESTPHYGLLAMGGIMLALGLALLAASIEERSGVFLWVGLGIALGGGGCFVAAWQEDQRLPKGLAPNPGLLAMAGAMLLVGILLLLSASYTQFTATSHLVWIGIGVTLGGGGCLAGAWQQERDNAQRKLQRTNFLPPTISKPLSATAYEEARRQVRAPALGLIVAGTLNLLPLALAILAIPAVILVPSTDTIGPPVQPVEPVRANLVSAAPLAPMVGSVVIAQTGPPQPESIMSIRLVALWVGLLILASVPLSGVLILGGIKMRQLELYGLAIVASILALLPCHVGWIVGFPVGLWSCFVLSRPDVKAAFAQQRAEG